ncbi:hypothetical protein THAOC_16123 [Thalassiosira oceanica]|uniref:Uncharacterized protein n=1 Tax=Thalassiosira oceanica TaxID=159749 RepID=K0SQE9_THAOC|nr:hypothetical protein THAOC_16123 [Thalassiosira oceanica]|eukprot:EJK63236.1 hypothetical protein THAOC_16123 [Thalassiosira oceanica]
MVHLRSSPFEDLADPSYASSDRLGGDGIPYHDRPVWLFQDEAVNEVSNGTDWTLSTCCGTNEIIFLSLTAGYLVAIYFLWNTIVMKPMKLIAVFVHVDNADCRGKRCACLPQTHPVLPTQVRRCSIYGRRASVPSRCTLPGVGLDGLCLEETSVEEKSPFTNAAHFLARIVVYLCGRLTPLRFNLSIYNLFKTSPRLQVILPTPDLKVFN